MSRKYYVDGYEYSDDNQLAQIQKDVRELASHLSSQTGALDYNTKVRSFPSQIVHQLATIQPGQSGYVWQYDAIRSDSPALLRYIGVKWFANSIISFRIDGTEVESITRTVGDINNPIGNPIVLQRPYMATTSIDFYVQNNDPTLAHVFEVYCQGELVNANLTNQQNFPGGADMPSGNPLGL